MDDDRFRRMALLVLLVNITMLTLGVLGYAWQARREASRPVVPTHLAQVTPN